MLHDAGCSHSQLRTSFLNYPHIPTLLGGGMKKGPLRTTWGERRAEGGGPTCAVARIIDTERDAQLQLCDVVRVRWGENAREDLKVTAERGIL